jgi:hypothetical protein
VFTAAVRTLTSNTHLPRTINIALPTNELPLSSVGEKGPTQPMYGRKQTMDGLYGIQASGDHWQ